MRHAKKQSQTNGPFLKTALVLWTLALCGIFLVLPYVGALENKALAAAAARAHLEVRGLLAISVVQAALLLAVAVVVGQWAAWKLGLGTPLIVALLNRRPAPENTLSTLPIAFALGIVTALALVLLDRWAFAPIPSVAELLHNAESGSAKPSAWQGFLACFYGALDEEILMRFGLVSLACSGSPHFSTFARGEPQTAAADRPILGGKHLGSRAIRTRTPAGNCCTRAVVGRSCRQGDCTKRGRRPRIWRTVQAFWVGVGNDFSFWRGYRRPRCPRVNLYSVTGG